MGVRARHAPPLLFPPLPFPPTAHTIPSPLLLLLAVVRLVVKMWLLRLQNPQIPLLLPPNPLLLQTHVLATPRES